MMRSPTSYLLVAGSHHGGWCWGPVARVLRQRGHDVFTPTLTGVGERVHLLGSETRLETHIADLEQVVRFEDLADIVLVAHSYGGIVAGGLVDRMPERFAEVVYFDALVPQDGLSAIQTLPPESQCAFTSHPAPDGLLHFTEESLTRWGLVDETERAWAKRRLTAHPAATVTDAIALSVPVERAGPPLTYIYARDKPTADWVAPSAMRARADPTWSYEEVDAPHDYMITHPELTARRLLRFARSSECRRDDTG